MMKKRFDHVEREKIVNNARECMWTDQGKPGRDYLMSTRNLSESTIKTFGLGYIPSFVQHQLCGRIILPLYDPSDNLIVVTSRSIFKDTSLPVYWHESYEKSFYLYGINVSRQPVVKCKFCIIVEGQFDAIQLHNHGIKNVVSLCGTKLSKVQTAVIQRYCDEMVLLLDVDANQTGQQAVLKIINDKKINYKSVRASGHVGLSNIVSVSFPENCDPDEFIGKYGIEKLKDLINGRRDGFYC